MAWVAADDDGGRGYYRAWARRAAAGTAQAAMPGAWGFALVPTPSGAAAAGHWAESVTSPPPVASPGSPGRETVRLAGIGIRGGVVPATAVTGQLAW